MVEPLICQMCGTAFGARSDAVYCSSACRQKAHRARTAQRIAELKWRQGSRRVLVKPDVAGTIARARLERRRSRELSRIATEILEASAESHEELKSVVWLHRARSAAAERAGFREHETGTISRRHG